MFEFLFKYPAAVFSKGQIVWLTPWPGWMLGLAILAAAVGLGWHVRRSAGRLSGARPAVIWVLQTALVALVMLLLWHPALSVATLRPQQNVISVLIDDSRSMATAESGGTRLEQAVRGLNDGVLDRLRKRFQVRLYRFDRGAVRIDKTEGLKAEAGVTRIGDAVTQALNDTATLPVGALVLLTDGGDNAGGIDRDTIARIRERRVPVHAVGYGRERIDGDVEIADVTLPARALADSRLSAQVTFRQNGYAAKKAKITIKEGGKVLAAEDITFAENGKLETATVGFPAGGAGARSFEVTVGPAAGEANLKNNTLSRLVNVESAKPRVLHIEGEPRWEYKFIRRAVEDDRSLQLVSMLRTTQNKIYRQGIAEPKELEDGFPAKVDELFGYAGLIIGDVEAGYFTAAQQEAIREFAARRGGGVLFLGGRATLAEGGYAASPLAEMLPVRLPAAKGTFHREKATFELTAAGRDSLICRLEDRPERNAERWKKMPQLADYQEVSEAKPGATVLGEAVVGGRRLPSLVLENYGRGRTGVFATSGSWRWQMLQDHSDRTHETFWSQLLRWLVADAPGRVTATTPRPVLADETEVALRVEVRDKQYQPLGGARVEARIVGPDGVAGTVDLAPDPLEDGIYTGSYSARKAGGYVAEVLARRDQEEVGRDVLMFRREDGVAENFHLGQNKELLERLAEQTGGRYYAASEIGKLPDLVPLSEAGISSRETRDLWDMPAVFLAALLLRAAEWVLRRKWGVV